MGAWHKVIAGNEEQPCKSHVIRDGKKWGYNKSAAVEDDHERHGGAIGKPPDMQEQRQNSSGGMQHMGKMITREWGKVSGGKALRKEGQMRGAVGRPPQRNCETKGEEKRQKRSGGRAAQEGDDRGMGVRAAAGWPCNT